MKDVPELLWAGVDQKGTTFYLEGVEKVVVEESDPKQPRNLVAAKKALLQIYMYQKEPLMYK